jgi:hypothetical protein
MEGACGKNRSGLGYQVNNFFSSGVMPKMNASTTLWGSHHRIKNNVVCCFVTYPLEDANADFK